MSSISSQPHFSGIPTHHPGFASTRRQLLETLKGHEIHLPDTASDEAVVDAVGAVLDSLPQRLGIPPTYSDAQIREIAQQTALSSDSVPKVTPGGLNSGHRVSGGNNPQGIALEISGIEQETGLQSFLQNAPAQSGIPSQGLNRIA